MMALPLSGKRVVVTQAAHQAPELMTLLENCGAQPLSYPCIAIEPPSDTTELDAALTGLANGEYDWLVLTSANTVLVLAQRCNALGLTPAALTQARLAAVGEATSEVALEYLGRAADLVPPEHIAENLGDALLAVVNRGERLLAPQADIARPVLVQSLRAGGLDVTPVVAYCTTVGSGGVELPSLLPHGVDAITFTSSSTVRNLLTRLENEGGTRGQLEGIVLACIGPITAATLESLGLPPHAVATKQSLEGLIEALITYWNPA
jgi:uroporphyrinogen-III synthase